MAANHIFINRKISWKVLPKKAIKAVLHKFIVSPLLDATFWPYTSAPTKSKPIHKVSMLWYVVDLRNVAGMEPKSCFRRGQSLRLLSKEMPLAMLLK